MKSFFISLLSLGLILSVWMVFDNYSETELHLFMASIDDKILPAVEDENWSGAIEDFEIVESQWKSYREKAAYFYSTISLNDIDYTIAKTKLYIKASDASNASGELACLRSQMKYLHHNESFIPENIF